MAVNLTAGVPSYICQPENYSTCGHADFVYFTRLAFLGNFKLNLVQINGSSDAHHLITNGTIDTSVEPFANQIPELNVISSLPTAPKYLVFVCGRKALLDTPLWFVLPMQRTVWVCVFVSLILSGLLFSYHESSKDLFWKILRATSYLINQGETIQENGLSADIFYFAWLMTAFLITSYYSAVLLTFLVAATEANGPSNLDEMLDAMRDGTYSKLQVTLKEFHLDVLSNTLNKPIDNIEPYEYISVLTDAMTKDGKEKVVKFVQEYPEKVQKLVVPDFSIKTLYKQLDILRESKDNPVLLTIDSPAFSMLRCNTKFKKVQIEGPTISEVFHMSRTPSSKPQRHALNQAIASSYEFDLREWLSVQQFVKQGGVLSDCIKLESVAVPPLNAVHVSGPLLLCGMGYTLAFIAFVAEKFKLPSENANLSLAVRKLSVKRQTFHVEHFHLPIATSELRTCQCCAKNVTDVQCGTCNAFLCVARDRNCFYKFHVKRSNTK